MNEEQIKSMVRWVVATFGGVLVGWGTSKGLPDMSSLLTNEAMIGVVSTIAVGAWSWIARRKSNMIVAAAKLPEVKGLRISDPDLAKEVQRKTTGNDTSVTLSQK